MNDKPLTWEEAVNWLKNQPDQIELVKSSYFDDPLIDAAERFYHSSEWTEIQKKIAGNKGIVLDLGAGRGISSYALAQDGWDVVALEPDNSSIVGIGAIEILKKESGILIQPIRAYAESLPFKNNCFDVVYGRQVLHHAYDLIKMCSEISRVLKPNGLVIITREHVISFPHDLPRFLMSHPLQQLYGRENAFTLNYYVKNLKRPGIHLHEILNPYASDINIYPESFMSIKIKIAKKIHFPYPALIPTWLIKMIGNLSHSPGRLYSFIGRKKIDQ